MMTTSCKRGDTFIRHMQAFSDHENGVEWNLTGYLIRCQIRDAARSLISTCTVTITDALNGMYDIECDETATRAWPIQNLSADIEFQSPSGHVVSTDTFTITIVEDITI